MAGRFDELKEEEWKMIAPLIPEEPYIFGRPIFLPGKLCCLLLFAFFLSWENISDVAIN